MVYFLSFQTPIQQIIRRWDSKSQPLRHEFTPITVDQGSNQNVQTEKYLNLYGSWIVVSILRGFAML